MIEKQWVVYILECKDGTLYTGITDNMQHRMAVHGTDKGAKYIRGRGPFTLAYLENCDDHSHALRREYAIKQLSRQQKLLLCSAYHRKEDNE